jgi:hypothetical protein
MKKLSREYEELSKEYEVQQEEIVAKALEVVASYTGTQLRILQRYDKIPTTKKR